MEGVMVKRIRHKIVSQASVITLCGHRFVHAWCWATWRSDTEVRIRWCDVTCKKCLRLRR